MQRRRIQPCPDNRRIALGFGTAHRVHFRHFCGDLILVQSRSHHFHGFNVRIQRQINRLLEKSNLARRFNRAHRGDLRVNVFQPHLRRGKLQPIDNCLFMRVAAEFLLVGQNRVKRGVELGEIFHRGAHLWKRLHRGKSCARFDAWGRTDDIECVQVIESSEWRAIKAMQRLQEAGWERQGAPLPAGDLRQAIRALPAVVGVHADGGDVGFVHHEP